MRTPVACVAAVMMGGFLDAGPRIGLGPGDGPGAQSAAAPAGGIAKSSVRWVRTEGDALALAVTVEPQAGWHVYWKNPGDSGDCPSFELTLPAGWSAGAAVFPRPEAAILDDGAFYGYSRAVTYLVPVRVGPNAGSPAPKAAWSLTAKVMACKGMCVVSTITGGGAWPPDTGGVAAVKLAGGAFEGRSLPAPADTMGVSARIDAGRVTVEGPAQGRGAVRFIPDAVPGMQVPLPEGKPAIEGTVADGRFRLEFRLETPGVGAGQPRLAGLVLLGNEPGDPCVWLAVPQEVPAPSPASVPVRRGASEPPPGAK